MNSAESARHENMLSAAGSAGRAGQRTNELLRELIDMLKCKFDASRAAIMSEWTDRDMSVGNVIYKAGSVTVADILDHAAHEAKLDQGEVSTTLTGLHPLQCGDPKCAICRRLA